MKTIEICDKERNITITLVINKIDSFSKLAPELRDNRPRWRIVVNNDVLWAFEETWEIADAKYDALRALLEG